MVASTFFRGLVLSLLLAAVAAPAAADLAGTDRSQSAEPPGFSEPVSLSRFDRAVMAPAAGPVITVYVSMASTFLNSTERNMIVETLKSKYSFASTLINFTTVQPTTGSYHTLKIHPGRDTFTGADGTDWGEAWHTSCTVYAGEFTQDPAVSGAFTNSTARSNAIGETAAHELDHVLRGPGHSHDPGDVNCAGGDVNTTQRAADNRTFTTADKNAKIRNINNGNSFKNWEARDAKVHANVMAVFGSTVDFDEFLKPDCHHVSLLLELAADPNMFNLGVMTDDGYWDWADGIEMDPPGMYSIGVPPGTRLDFALYHIPSGEIFPISDFGEAWVDMATMIPPEEANAPVMTEPYYFSGGLHWDTPHGPVDCMVNAEPPEGLVVLEDTQTGIDDQGSLTPKMKLMQNYPNPFSRSTEIVFQVPEGASAETKIPVRISVFDVQGRLVRVLVDEPMGAGQHGVTLTGADLGPAASGIFFYRLEVGSETLTRKLMLIR